MSSDEEDDSCCNGDAPRLSLGGILSALAEEESDAIQSFQKSFWGKKVLNCLLDEASYTKLEEGFYQGDVAEVLKDCRKEESNALFSSQEMEEMISSLEHQNTLVLPFCFTPGAMELKTAFLEEMGDYGGSDVEVGVYVSRVGGGAAAWHYDNNHNITIQIRGQKDWHCIPGSPETWANRSLGDRPTNFLEQQVAIPSTGPANVTTYHLTPGSMIYLPPGYWHSVTPVEGESLSVDLRVVNILERKWICEAVFAGLSSAFRGGDGTNRSVSQIDTSLALKNELSDSLLEQTGFVSSHINSMMKACRLPRPLLPESQHSNGLWPGASLAFLQEHLSPLWDQKEMPEEVFINQMVSVILKNHGGGLIISLLSVSPLTAAEYLRFNIVCSSPLLCDPMKRFIALGRASVNDLQVSCPTPAVAQEMAALLRVLLYCNALHSESESLHLPQKRKRAT